MDYKGYIAEKLDINDVEKSALADFIEVPPTADMGDFALPCFKLAKVMRKSPVMIANELKEKFNGDATFTEVSAVNGYLNFKINRENFTAELLSDDWFDSIFKYEGGSNLIQVTDNGKVNLFDLSNRELLLSEWVDEIEYDEDIDFLGIVKKDNKYNLLNDHGEFVLPMFVDEYETNTMIMSDIIGKYFDRDKAEYQEKDNMVIYPRETFCYYDKLSEKVYTKHLMLGSWG